jgi:molybdopterin-guanine dinucleotide biosynthesis protein A
MSKDLAVVILAGGQGRRMGGDKPARLLGGERLIDRALRLARGWSDGVAVALRERAQATPGGVPAILDDPAIDGPLAGLASALRFAAGEGRPLLLTIPADMPFLPSDLTQRLAEAMGEQCCAIAASGGHGHPVCALWRTRALDSLDEYLSTGERSLKRFAALVGCSTVEWPAVPLDPFFNINTPEDLARAEALKVEYFD